MPDPWSPTTRGPLADLIAELLRQGPESRPGASETGQRLEDAAVPTATADTARLPAPGAHTPRNCRPPPGRFPPVTPRPARPPAAVRAGLAVLVAAGGMAHLARRDGESGNTAPDTAATGPSPSPETSDGQEPSATRRARGTRPPNH